MPGDTTSAFGDGAGPCPTGRRVSESAAVLLQQGTEMLLSPLLNVTRAPKASGGDKRAPSDLGRVAVRAVSAWDTVTGQIRTAVHSG